MFIRTYQRRNRSGRSLSDSGFTLGDGVGSSNSQDSPWSSSQETFPSSLPSSQESCWWQGDHGNTFLVASRPSDSFAKQSNGNKYQDDGRMAKFSRQPPSSWAYNETEVVQSSITTCDAKKRFTQDLDGKGLVESFVVNGDFTSSGRCKESGWVGRLTSTSVWEPTTPATSTLMEAQESGEMMEQMDEANFAMDGLKPEQPLRVQRASLQSLLCLCGSMQRRRFLRTHGLAKPFLDAVVSLPTDDPPLALAAAAVLYFLASDGQNEDLFDSVECVRFLMRLLGPCLSQPAKKSLLSVGSKLAGLGAKVKTGTAGLAGLDRGGAAVVAKVHQLFAREGHYHGGVGNQEDWSGYALGQEVTSKWLALLTLEKACISTVVLEDNSGAVRKVGGCFKERLRELGGLDAICDLAAGCVLNLREALEAEDGALKNCEKIGGVDMLLRCLRVMENVTFLSEQNQTHLLELRLPRGKKDAPNSFIGLVINSIKILSELGHHLKERRDVHGKRNSEVCSVQDCEGPTKTKLVVKSTTAGLKEVSKKDLSIKSATFGESFYQRKKMVKLSSLRDIASVSSGIFKRSPSKSLSQLKPQDDFGESQCSAPFNHNSGHRDGKLLVKEKLVTARPGTKKLLISGPSWLSKHDLSPKAASLLKRKGIAANEDSQDPFAFDDVDLTPDFDKPNKKKPRKVKKLVQVEESIDSARVGGCRGEIPTAEAPNEDLVEATISMEGHEEHGPQATLFAECLLSAVKVLMNLTNDNPVGCRQVATCGGLDSMASLLVAHFPNLQSGSPLFLTKDGKEKISQGLQQHGTTARLKEKGGHADHDLDLLVVALGVLCNLVEKDEGNRARLAILEVELPPHIAAKEGGVWRDRGMIALLCALFLSKQGAGEVAEANEERMAMEMDVEANVKQGEREAEDMIVEAYAALLLAFLSRESDRALLAIAELLPGDDLTVLVPVLERFLAFHLSLNMLSAETHAAVTDVVNSCRQPLPVIPSPS